MYRRGSLKIRFQGRKGQSAVEYILLTSLVAGVLFFLQSYMGPRVIDVLTVYAEGMKSPRAASGGKDISLYYEDNGSASGSARIEAK